MTITFALTGMLSLNACTAKHSEPNWAYAPDMHYSVALKAQEAGSMRPPVKGTIPRGFRPYEVASIAEAARLNNPLPRTKEVMKNGQGMYNVYCAVCHGKMGEGDGSVTPNFPRPPSLQSEKIRDYKDGQIFHIMTLGQNLMPAYADRVSEEERWAIVHYIRALYRAKHPTAEDMKKAVQIVKNIKGKRPLLEASGGINLKNILATAKSGVDRISIGALTHHVQAIDISLELTYEKK